MVEIAVLECGALEVAVYKERGGEEKSVSHFENECGA